jgi:TolB protein
MFWASCVLLSACGGTSSSKHVPHQARWGLYELDLASNDVRLIYSSSDEINGSALRLNVQGDTLVFAQRVDGATDEDYEICSVRTDGTGFRRLTSNNYMDLYPAWSPDGVQIAFISLRDKSLDIYVMDADGQGERLLFDSGFHDADIDWGVDGIAFTSNDRVWTVREDGTQPRQVTGPRRAGEWGKANLPFGDYDPRQSPRGSEIVFERLEDDSSPNGDYNLYLIHGDGSGETRLTVTGYSQGLASWDHLGTRIVYTVAAIAGAGVYDLYMINADGTNGRNITPGYFPDTFLAHAATFSADDSRVLFVGEWWE